MSLHKAIYHGKEKRKLYTGSKNFDSWCLNHGRCRYCLSNRLHKHYKTALSTKEEIKGIDSRSNLEI